MALVNIYSELQKRIEKSKGLMEYERQAWLFFKTYQTELTRWQRKVSSEKTDWSTLSKGSYSKRIVSGTGSMPGQFYFYMYDPKLRQTLPYYDRFPLTLVLDKGPNWFFGMNFHYLSYEHRARFFDALYPFVVDEKTSLKAKIKVTYDILQMTTKSSIARFYQPTLKKYLINHLRTPLLQVGVEYWHLALFLPVEMFQKKTKAYVWRESMKSARRADEDEDDGSAEDEG